MSETRHEWTAEGWSRAEAWARVTHLAIGAHPDDAEFMAMPGIEACHFSAHHWFGAVIVTDGAGSVRTGPLVDLPHEALVRARREEQFIAARLGRYAAVDMLGWSSREVRDLDDPRLAALLRPYFASSALEVVYLHNPFDKHPTHQAVLWHCVQAIRGLPPASRPRVVLGCEVWRGLDWLPEDARVALPVRTIPGLADEIIGVFASQIAGGKRYDRAVPGRWQANATYANPHELDPPHDVLLAVDLSAFCQGDAPLHDYVEAALTRFENELCVFPPARPPRLPDDLELADLPDAAVTPALDRELRDLLTLCFPGPIFVDKRYNQRMPRHRWLVRERQGGRLVGHVAVHDRELRLGEVVHPFGGIAEVCVHPDHRGKRLVPLILGQVHAWLRSRGYPFALLGGEGKVYQSSGYRPIPQPVRYLHDDGTQRCEVLPWMHYCAFWHHVPWTSDSLDILGGPF